jgi:hypothetical protein
LRELIYTGNITLVLPKGHLPYDENLLNKRFKGTVAEDFYFRQADWYEGCGIETVKGMWPVAIHKKYQNNYIQLEDSRKLVLTRFQ